MTFPARHGHPWTDFEKKALIQGFKDGKTVKELAALHDRLENAIQIQLEKQGHYYLDCCKQLESKGSAIYALFSVNSRQAELLDAEIQEKKLKIESIETSFKKTEQVLSSRNQVIHSIQDQISNLERGLKIQLEHKAQLLKTLGEQQDLRVRYRLELNELIRQSKELQ